jgi:xanthine dehydrogenase iron-sulfur cluster and FAD-binding subunit A
VVVGSSISDLNSAWITTSAKVVARSLEVTIQWTFDDFFTQYWRMRLLDGSVIENIVGNLKAYKRVCSSKRI